MYRISVKLSKPEGQAVSGNIWQRLKRSSKVNCFTQHCLKEPTEWHSRFVEKHKRKNDDLYTASQKNCQNCFCRNFVKFPLSSIILGIKIAKMRELCKMHSPLHQICVSVLHCETQMLQIVTLCTTQWLFVSDCSPLHHQFNRGCHVV